MIASLAGFVLINSLNLGLYIVHVFVAGNARYGFPLAWVIGVIGEGLVYALFGALIVGWFAGGPPLFSTTRCAYYSCKHTPSLGRTSDFLTPPPTIFCFAAPAADTASPTACCRNALQPIRPPHLSLPLRASFRRLVLADSHPTACAGMTRVVPASCLNSQDSNLALRQEAW